ncbi:CD3324 family protein [Lysinibacillus sp. NPDC097214]|uniref:CD3324 family protein n=1 Tax=Lysinibacillus sp. NPDC097214 TaxID=3390584 RepID=UPI003D03A8C3
MSYKKAKHILPAELLELIQEYVDGEYIYIPRRAEHKKDWGSNTATRKELDVRNYNFFQRVSKKPLKEVKASGGCHGIGKEFFVQAQSRFRTQLCRGIIDFL